VLPILSLVPKFYPQLSPAFARLLAGLAGRKVAVIGHSRPDGDCIGSQVALARVLAATGLEVVCVNADPVPRRLQFLTSGMTFLRTDEALAWSGKSAAVFVDCADDARAGERLRAAFPAPAGNIDHHLSNIGYAAADLMLCRGGAITVAETTALGVPAIYVPYPHSNQEQKRNALPVVESGGGILVDNAELTPEWIEHHVIPLARDPRRLAAMGAAAGQYGRRDGDEALLEFVLEVVAKAA